MNHSAVSPPTESGAAVSAGQRLKQTREQRGMSVEQVAAALRLDARAIEALESGNFSVLGPSVYVKGHLQNYAALLRLDAGELLAWYEGELPADAGPEPFGMAVQMDKRSRRRRRVLLFVMAIVLLAAAGAAAAWWWMQQ